MTYPQGNATTDDVVTLLKNQHQLIRGLFARVEAAEGTERRDAFRDLVRMLAVHETAEEEIVHPAARRAADGGDRVVDERLAEEHEAKELLARLDGMDPGDPEFLPGLRTLRDAVLAHAEAEERHEFTLLRQHTDTRRLERMARAVRAAEAMAPTRPHPGTESAAKNAALGPVVAVVDRTRDLVRRAMDGRD
jgi:hemerythrin superfamily protein